MITRPIALLCFLPVLLSCGTVSDKLTRARQGTEPDRPGVTVPPAPLGPGELPIPPKVVVLSVPGLDPERIEVGMREGWLPNLRRLRTSGTLTRMIAPTPAAATACAAGFFTGGGLDQHGIAGDLRRSLSPGVPEAVPASYRIDWRPREELFPRGAPDGYPERFPVVRSWLTPKTLPVVLAQSGLRSRILRARAGLSALVSPRTEVLGAGALPDLSFGRGAYTFAMEDPALPARQVTARGGVLLRSLPSTRGEEFDTFLIRVPGPPRLAADREELAPPAPEESRQVETTITVRLTKGRSGGLARTSDHQVELTAGRFTEPLILRFEVAPGLELFGRSRLYLRPTGKKLMELYIEPPDFVPSRTPAWQAVSHPAEWAGELERLYGPLPRFGSAFPGEALADGLLDGRDAATALSSSFQAEHRLFSAQLVEGNFDLLYQSFSLLEETALIGPGANEEVEFFGERVTRLRLLDAATAAIDQLLGEALAVMDSGRLGEQVTVILLAPYGASPPRRLLDLNRFLVNRGDLFLKGPPEAPLPEQVDWNRTRAYALGSGIYVNLIGREPNGQVARAEAGGFLSALEADLLRVRDALADKHIVASTWQFTSFAPEMDAHGFPDLLVGLGPGYGIDRSSATFQRIGPLLSATGTGMAMGSAASAPAAVPGVFGLSRIVEQRTSPTIQDVSATVLSLLKVPLPDTFMGTPYPAGRPMALPEEESLRKERAE